jgi:hypothetical protein
MNRKIIQNVLGYLIGGTVFVLGIPYGLYQASRSWDPNIGIQLIPVSGLRLALAVILAVCGLYFALWSVDHCPKPYRQRRPPGSVKCGNQSENKASGCFRAVPVHQKPDAFRHLPILLRAFDILEFYCRIGNRRRIHDLDVDFCKTDRGKKIA